MPADRDRLTPVGGVNDAREVVPHARQPFQGHGDAADHDCLDLAKCYGSFTGENDSSDRPILMNEPAVSGEYIANSRIIGEFG